MASTMQFEPEMSIYIPRCDTRSLPRRGRGETDESYESRVSNYIASKFNMYGDVTRVDLLAKMTPDNYTYYVAFLHINWYDRPESRQLQADILDPKTPAKLYYDNGRWFWHLNKNSKPLSAEEAALHKRIYNLERDLLKVTGDRDAAHVLLLKEAAPDRWQALREYATTHNPRDLDGAMRAHVQSFIPTEFLAPLRIEVAPPSPVVTRSYASGSQIVTPPTSGIPLHPPQLRRSTNVPARSLIDDLEDGEIDSPPPLTRTWATGRSNVIPAVQRLFDAQLQYEEECSRRAEERVAAQPDDAPLHMPASGTICPGCLTNQPGQMAHMGPSGCLGDEAAWDSPAYEEENDSIS